MNTTATQQTGARIEENLDGQIRRLRRDVRWITILGLALFLGVFSYFVVVAGIIQDEMNPKDLAKVSGVYLTDFMVSSLKGYLDNLILGTPELAGGVLDSGFHQAQSLTSESRTHVLGWIDEHMNELEKSLSQVVDIAYGQHGAELQSLVKDLKSPEGKKIFEERLSAIVEGALASEAGRIDLETYGPTFDGLKEKMTRITTAKDLPPQEALEQQILLAFREFLERKKGN